MENLFNKVFINCYTGFSPFQLRVVEEVKKIKSRSEVFVINKCNLELAGVSDGGGKFFCF